MGQERLQKLMARAGKWSRRRAEELIRESRVTVNGQPATIGQQADPAVDAVKVDGQRLHIPTSPAGIHVLLNKPPGYVSTRSDPEGRPTVLDLLPARLRDTVRPVGRLDFNTEGLLLLTDDGELAHRVAHPRFGCVKSYEVKVKGRPDRAALERLRTGVKLEGKLTAPAKVDTRRVRGARELSTNTWWTIAINEGRTRQIREMFFRVGHPVQRLRRVAIGPLRDPLLRIGGWRMVTDEEIERLTAALAQDPPANKQGGGPSRTSPDGMSRKRSTGRPTGRRAESSAASPTEKASRPPRAPRTGRSGTTKFNTAKPGAGKPRTTKGPGAGKPRTTRGKGKRG